MNRIHHAPREGWQARVESQGLTYHTHAATPFHRDAVTPTPTSDAPRPYWCETAHYELSAAEVDALEAAADAVHGLCLQVIPRTLDQAWIMGRLGLPEHAGPLLRASWERQEPSFYGRFDFGYDPSQDPHPKLYEYNADTPTGLVEAAVTQWFWLEDRYGGINRDPKALGQDQFNGLHEALVDRWRRIGRHGSDVHFAGLLDVPEDAQNLVYLADTAQQAGLKPHLLDIREVGWNAGAGEFRDREDHPLRTLFKLYPWEDLLREPFAAHLTGAGTRWIEPAWKILLGNKAILTLLWELFPGHPNLLPATFEPDRLAQSAQRAYVRKPNFGREGQNVQVCDGNHTVAMLPGAYGDDGFVCQAQFQQPGFAAPDQPEEGDARVRPVFGVWMVGDKSCGLGIREESGPITSNRSRFVPHRFTSLERSNDGSSRGKA